MSNLEKIKEKLNAWLNCFVLATLLSLTGVVMILILSRYPVLSDAFDNFYQTNFIFRNNIEDALKYSLIACLVVVPFLTILLRALYNCEVGD